MRNDKVPSRKEERLGLGREGSRKDGTYLDGVPGLDDGRVKLVTEDGDVAYVEIWWAIQKGGEGM